MTRPILAAVLVILLPACAGPIDLTGPIPIGPIPVLLISPSPARVAVGATLTLTADVRDVDPTLDRNAITWSDPAPQIATVTGSGAAAVVRGVAPGTVSITATHTPTRLFNSVQLEVTP